MTIETAVNNLLQQQEEILNIFNDNISIWNNKLDLVGGTITGDVTFNNFGLFDLEHKVADFSAVINITGNIENSDSILNINSNGTGTSKLNIGIDTDSIHGSEINIGNSILSLLKISRTSTGSSIINHTGVEDLTISTSSLCDIDFKINGSSKLKLLSNGNIEIYRTVTVFQDILLTNNRIIGQIDNAHALILSGGIDLANENAHITLHSGLDGTVNEGGLDFYVNGEVLTPAISVDNTRISSFANTMIAPILTLSSGIVDENQLPQLNFIDATQSANNKTWQIKAENANLVIQPLNDLGTPGNDVVRFIRSTGTNSLSGVSFGTENELLLDVMSPAIKINNLNVLGPRRSGWTNISNIPDMSKNLGLITGDSTSIAKLLRALVSELVTHGLIGV
jgi:hypothetical protein